MEDLSLFDAAAKLLSLVFTPGELSQIKTNLALVGFIWIIVEWRTRKRFHTLEQVVTTIQDGFTKLQAGFDDMKNSFKAIIVTMKQVEESDSTSTKMLGERIERQSGKITGVENVLTRLNNRTTIVETKLGIIPADETTTKEKQP